MNKHLFAYCLGLLTSGFITALRQDVLGLERYIEAVRAGWLNTPWLVWPPLIVAAVAALVWSSFWRERP